LLWGKRHFRKRSGIQGARKPSPEKVSLKKQNHNGLIAGGEGPEEAGRARRKGILSLKEIEERGGKSFLAKEPEKKESHLRGIKR